MGGLGFTKLLVGLLQGCIRGLSGFVRPVQGALFGILPGSGSLNRSDTVDGINPALPLIMKVP